MAATLPSDLQHRMSAGDFTQDLDLSHDELLSLLDLSAQVKRNPTRFARVLTGRYAALLFEKPSLRTRITFELAVKQLGGDSILNNGLIAEREPRQHGDRRDEHCQHKQQPAGRCSDCASGASVESVTEPLSSNSRRSSATASAVAENATTMPVISSACGTGSPAMPAAAPLRATAPSRTNTPLPITLNARILRSGCGLTISPKRPMPTRSAAHNPNTVAAVMASPAAAARRPAAAQG